MKKKDSPFLKVVANRKAAKSQVHRYEATHGMLLLGPYKSNTSSMNKKNKQSTNLSAIFTAA